MTTKNFELTLAQCRQIANKTDLRDFIAEMDNQPDWIICNQSLDVCDIQAIQQGGCESGAYIPAVTYHTANETMSEHGDDVLDYINERLGGELPKLKNHESWFGMAVFYLSYAVELWCSQFDLDGVDWD